MLNKQLVALFIKRINSNEYSFLNVMIDEEMEAKEALRHCQKNISLIKKTDDLFYGYFKMPDNPNDILKELL